MIEFVEMDGREARQVDPEGVEWPDGTLVLYAVEQGEIVGRQAYLLFPHLEGAWVREDKRGSSVAYRLVRKTEQCIAKSGYPVAFAFVLDAQPEVADYMKRMKYEELPLRLYMKRLDQEEEASA